MKVKLNFFPCFALFLLLYNCNEESKLQKEIAEVDISFKAERFDSEFSKVDATNLGQLKNNYPFLFPKEVSDSVWINRVNDDLQKQMFAEVNKEYQNFTPQEDGLRNLFQHLKYYDKGFTIPRVITVTDFVDYRTKLVLESDLLIINLTNYLGETHEFYQNTPRYFAENMTSAQIIPDVCGKYAMRYAYQNQRKTFLDEIIYHGKLLYFKDIMIPNSSVEDRIGYSTNDIKWAQENEPMIWSYFVEKELLFSTDPKLFSRFTTPAPFSKFYLELDNESPGRLGQFIGWQIVRAYADRTEADIIEIMRTEADVIFNKSKYKPKL
ncbi:MAG: gliding motility lipoprotein GldB [Winogradskyella sp.]|uniref:gliding motility lipoprotein GldB n=1 Tax=Winogradskyella sp. TaxID=1883156 RepID=UPI000F3F3408|nr:gliding motility lipoprotein GldB [Winogradskyella sp.]RNC87670.1 MAG: gliding motility lipoprotein GldB [Winogradskyella sp.]